MKFKALFPLFLWSFLLTTILFGCQKPVSGPTGSQAIPKTSASVVQKEGENYHFALEVNNPPLMVGKETYIIRIMDPRTHHPIAFDTIGVEVVMGTGPSLMKAPTLVKKQTEAGTYEVTTEFTMAGPWDIQIKPLPSDKVTSFTVNVKGS
jgi:hypothetical protein